MNRLQEIKNHLKVGSLTSSEVAWLIEEVENISSLESYMNTLAKSVDHWMGVAKNRKIEIEEWKELFFLLKQDHELLENFQTDEWKKKAGKMGVNV